MSKIDLQYDLVNYTPASASPVEANFNRIEQHINQELIERDGTVAMTAQLKLVGDPVAALDAAPKQYVDQVLPIGIIMMFGGATAPPGGRWALCNGAELESVAYPDLFAVIGRNFSPAGTPAGRFNLPNLVDRFAVGAGTIAAIGAAGGSKDAVLPSHSHDDSHGHSAGSGTVSADHTHYVPAANTSDVSSHHDHYLNWGEVYHHTTSPTDNVNVFSVRIGDGITIQMEKFPTTSYPTNMAGNHVHATQAVNTGGISTNHTHGITVNGHSGRTSTEGASATNANLPPYLGVAHIMRVS